MLDICFPQFHFYFSVLVCHSAVVLTFGFCDSSPPHSTNICKQCNSLPFSGALNTFQLISRIEDTSDKISWSRSTAKTVGLFFSCSRILFRWFRAVRTCWKVSYCECFRRSLQANKSCLYHTFLKCDIIFFPFCWISRVNSRHICRRIQIVLMYILNILVNLYLSLVKKTYFFLSNYRFFWGVE